MDDLQEKFQTIVGPIKHEDGEAWASFESARRTYPNRSVEALPPTEIYEPCVHQHGMRLVTASATDVTDDVNPWDLKGGFAKHKMRGTDDQYTGEHADHFYGEVHGADEQGRVTGFAERNNYLDRL